MGCTFRFFCGGRCGCRGWREFRRRNNACALWPASPDGEAMIMTMCAGISAYRARPATSTWSSKARIPRQPVRHTGFTHVSGTCPRYVVLPVCPGQTGGLGFAGGATPDDDEHYVYAIPL